MTEKQIYKTVCQNDLAFYTQQAFKVLEPETKYEHNWHVDVICQHLQNVYKGEIRNLDINIPPRTIKSVLVNVIFPTWCWLKEPSFKFISCSYSDALSVKFNMKRRDLIKSEFYQMLSPIKIKEDADQQRYIENEHNGFFLSTSVGGSATGMGADILLMDDALSAQDSFSTTKREFANHWYASTFHNRLKDKRTGRRINVMQRLHEKDLSGFLSENYNFEKLVIPMIKEKTQVTNSTNWVDPRNEGEFLHPQRYSENEMQDEIKGLGSYGWAGQMQQRPAPQDGGIIKKDWIKVESIKDISFERKIISIDATFKGGKNSDFVSMQVWGKTKTDFCLIDQLRGKWGFITTVKNIKKLEEKHQTKRIFIEDKANGPAIINVLKSELTGIKAVNPKDSKEARLHSIAHFFETGNIIFDKNLNDLDDLINELLFFPNAKHDDMVDALTQAIQELQNSNSFYAVGRPLQSY